MDDENWSSAVSGTGEAVDTPIGRVPTVGAIDTSGIDVDDATMAKLLEVDADSWRPELPQLDEHYQSIGETVPTVLRGDLPRFFCSMAMAGWMLRTWSTSGRSIFSIN